MSFQISVPVNNPLWSANFVLNPPRPPQAPLIPIAQRLINEQPQLGQSTHIGSIHGHTINVFYNPPPGTTSQPTEPVVLEERYFVDETREISEPGTRKRKPNKVPKPGKCLECSAESTKQWRRGPAGTNTLCNACGLAFSKYLRSLNCSQCNDQPVFTPYGPENNKYLCKKCNDIFVQSKHQNFIPANKKMKLESLLN